VLLLKIDLLGTSIEGDIQVVRYGCGVARRVPQFLLPDGKSGG
jgi:hypothetical protein